MFESFIFYQDKYNQDVQKTDHKHCGTELQNLLGREDVGGMFVTLLRLTEVQITHYEDIILILRSLCVISHRQAVLRRKERLFYPRGNNKQDWTHSAHTLTFLISNFNQSWSASQRTENKHFFNTCPFLQIGD
jgi:hypothetical protein